MNFVQADCQPGWGKDVWFRISNTQNLSHISCEPLGTYIAIPALLSVLTTVLIIILVVGLALSPQQRRSVKRTYAVNIVFLSFIVATIWYGFGSSEGNSADGRYIPIVLFSAIMVFYFIAALLHYHEMQSLAGKLMIGDQSATQSSTFISGLQTALGNNTRLDRLLILMTQISLLLMAVVFWILLPISPSPMAPWNSAEGGGIFQKDFFVSLGMWLLAMSSTTFVGSALLLLWKIRNYIKQHLTNWSRMEANGQDEMGGNENREAWRKLLGSILNKLNHLIIQSLVGYIVGCTLLLCMSLDWVLGLRWWAVYLILLVTLTQSTFVIGLHFPKKELRRRVFQVVDSSEHSSKKTPVVADEFGKAAGGSFSSNIALVPTANTVDSGM